ncbi:LysR family transcriptional regulator [Pseudonocardia sp. GCM10023141]|uniref:LysR family transcriptional regulator n=1 Tax=Pseudonocardia sp. GCM10023141 TaxID=3252653 RepID=UPI0036076884
MDASHPISDAYLVHLDPRLLATLEAVARSGSFAAAAAELGYSSPAVSQQVAELERRTGLRVLDRRPVRVTDAGRVLLDAELALRSVLATATVELDAVRGGSVGELRLGAFASAAACLVPPAIARLRRTHEGVRIHLRQAETDACHLALARGDLDLAVTFDYAFDPVAPAPAVTRSRISRDPIVAVLPGDHPLRSRSAVDLADLADETWVAAPQAGVRLDHLQRLAGRHGFTHRLQFEGDDVHTVLGLVAAGLCVTLLPMLALRHSAADVITRPLAGPPLEREVYVSRLRARRTPPVVLALEEHLRAAAG